MSSTLVTSQLPYYLPYKESKFKLKTGNGQYALSRTGRSSSKRQRKTKEPPLPRERRPLVVGCCRGLFNKAAQLFPDVDQSPTGSPETVQVFVALEAAAGKAVPVDAPVPSFHVATEGAGVGGAAVDGHGLIGGHGFHSESSFLVCG